MLFGATLATAALSLVSWRCPASRRSVAFGVLGVCSRAAIPAWFLMRGGGQWIYSKEGFSRHDDPTWIGSASSSPTPAC